MASGSARGGDSRLELGARQEQEPGGAGSLGSGDGTPGSVRQLLPVGILTTTVLAAALVGTAVTSSGPVPGLLEPAAVVRLGLPVVRALLDIGAVFTVGLSLLAKLVGFDRPTDTEPVMAPARRAAVLSAMVWVVCALLAVVLQTAELHPDEPVTFGLVVDYVRQVGSGQGLVASAGVAALYLGFAVLAVRFGEAVPAELRIVLALFALLPITVTGHASNWRWHDISMVSMELHVMGAAAWTGGLICVVILLAARPRLLARALPRFSTIATLALTVVGITGTLNGFTELLLTPGLPMPSGLVTSGYGQLVLAKLGCLTLLGLLGANIRWRLLPMIIERRPTALLGWASVEVAVMGVAYGLGVALSRAPVLTG